MNRIKKILDSRLGRFGLAAFGLFALTLPAIAEPFDFDGLQPEQKPTYEDLEIDCPAAGAEPTDEEKAACDAAVQTAFESLMQSDHPENHGKYVSFVADCLEGVKGKGRFVRQIAQEKGDAQAELAVKLCAEAALEQQQEAAEEDADLETKAKEKPESHSSPEDQEVKPLESDDRSSSGDKGKSKTQDKEKARRR